MAAAFLVIIIFDRTESSTCGAFNTGKILNSGEREREATRKMAISKVVGQIVRINSDRFMFRRAQGNLLRANTVSTVAKVDLSSYCLCSLAALRIHQACSFFSNRFRVQTVATAMNATECVQITAHRTHACAHFSSLRATRRTIHPMHLHRLIVFKRPFVCFSEVIPSATMSLPGCS